MVLQALILLFATLFISSLSAPLLYAALLGWWSNFPWPYSRVFDRVAMLVALLLIICMRKRFDLSPLNTFLRGNNDRLKMFLVGVCLSVVASVILVPLLVQTGSLVWKIEVVDYYLTRIPKVLAAAVIISLIEEGFFRGVLLQNMLRSYKPPLAILLISVFYAAVHFIAPVKGWNFPDYSVSVGFLYLGSLFNQAFTIELLAPFVGLFLVGITLGLAMVRHRNLYLCIGLHAGWIMVVKGVFYLTAINSTEKLSPLATRYFVVSHPISWLSIVLVAVVIMLMPKSGSR